MTFNALHYSSSEPHWRSVPGWECDGKKRGVRGGEGLAGFAPTVLGFD